MVSRCLGLDLIRLIKLLFSFGQFMISCSQLLIKKMTISGVLFQKGFTKLSKARFGTLFLLRGS